MNRHDNDNNSSTCGECDYILLDGVKYYSDRFYLNSPLSGSNNNEESPSPSSMSTNSASAEEANLNGDEVLLDRSRLIKSLDLIGVIASTYTFDPDWLHVEFPTLFPSSRKLVRNRTDDDSLNNVKADDDDTGKEDERSSGLDIPTLILHGMKEGTFTKKKQKENLSTAKNDDYDDDCNDDYNPFGPSVYFTRILPKWTSSNNNNTKPPHNDDRGNNSSSSSKQDCRKWERGVHHAKYFLLFEKSGSLIVLVTTANLSTPYYSVDATWMQRFHYCLNNNNINNKSSEDNSTTATSTVCNNNSKKEYKHDFGYVLADLLDKSTQAMEEPKQQPHRRSFLSMGKSPLDFIQNNIMMNTNNTTTTIKQQINSWKDFSQAWSFQNAHVHLVSTVPGTYITSSSSHSSSSFNDSLFCFYGPHRIRDILNQLKRPMPIPSFSYYSNNNTNANNNNIDTKEVKKPVRPVSKRRKIGKRGIQKVKSSSSSTSSSFPKRKEPWIPASSLDTPNNKNNEKDSTNTKYFFQYSKEKDYLFIQPTSIGGTWTEKSMSRMVQTLMSTKTTTTTTKTTTKSLSSHKKIKSITNTNTDDDDSKDLYSYKFHILWPTLNYIQSCTFPNSTPSYIHHHKDKEDDDSRNKPLFFSSKAFNKIDIACLSNMLVYEPSNIIKSLSYKWNDAIRSNNNKDTISIKKEDERILNVSPHIKSIARVLGNQSFLHQSKKNYENNGDDDTNDTCTSCFAWYFLTSSCLSEGAQGRVFHHPDNSTYYDSTTNNTTIHSKNNTASYSNFELGVLFCSRVQGNESTDRIYYCSSSSSSLDPTQNPKPDKLKSTTTNVSILRHRSHKVLHDQKVNMIPLSVPYKIPIHFLPSKDNNNIRNERYILNPQEDLDFSQIPYLHEVHQSDVDDSYDGGGDDGILLTQGGGRNNNNNMNFVPYYGEAMMKHYIMKKSQKGQAKNKSLLH